MVVTEIVQKTFISVDESGTEAAAASAGNVGITNVDPNPPPVMICNRPFFYMLVHKTSNTALFMGRVKNAGEGTTADTIGTFYHGQPSGENTGDAAGCVAHSIALVASMLALAFLQLINNM